MKTYALFPLLALGLSVLASACCCGLDAPEEDQPPEHSTPGQEHPKPSNATSTSNPPPNRPSGPQTPPPPPELAPKSLGTAAQSEQAAPEWTSDAARRTPQIRHKASLFRSLRKHQTGGPISEAALICRIHTSGKFDTFRGPDLTTYITFNQEKAYKIRGPEDAWTMHASLPLVNLTSQDKIKITVVDRDVFENEHIGTAQETYSGSMPLLLEAKNMDVSCVAVDRKTLEKELQTELEALEKIFREAPSSFQPRPHLADWGYGQTRLPALKREINQAAALVGWDDPRVRQRTRKISILEAQWTEKIQTSLAAEKQNAHKPGTPFMLLQDDLNVNLEGITCKRAEIRRSMPRQSKLLPLGNNTCAVTAHITNKGLFPVEVDLQQETLGKLRSLRAVRPNGKTLDLPFAASSVPRRTPTKPHKLRWIAPNRLATKGRSRANPEKFKLAPGETITTLWLSHQTLENQGAKRVEMLWVPDGSRGHFVRIE